MRAALIGALAFAAVGAGRLAALLRHRRGPAAARRCWSRLDLARSAAAADRTLAQFVDGLFAEGYDRPGRRPAAGRLGAAIDRALGALGAARAPNASAGSTTCRR